MLLILMIDIVWSN